jgi:hypothetical protein
MAAWDDVTRLALAPPETTEEHKRGRSRRVKGKGFVWERPLRKADLQALGGAASEGPIDTGELEELASEARLCQAPKRLAKEFIDSRSNS